MTVVASREELATEQIKLEEHQRILGFLLNFYVSYDENPAPLSSKLKFELALKVVVDPVTFAGTGFIATINQASHYPDYVEGIKGYGQRFGSAYLNDLTDIMMGGCDLALSLAPGSAVLLSGQGIKEVALDPRSFKPRHLQG